MSSKVYEVWLVLFNDLNGRRAFRLAPDEIHLRVNRTERESCFHDQQHAAVKEKTSAGQSESYGDQVIAWIAGKRNNPDCDAGRDEHSETHIKRDHTSLENARTAGELVELLKDRYLPFAFIAFGHAFETIGERANSIHNAAQT